MGCGGSSNSKVRPQDGKEGYEPTQESQGASASSARPADDAQRTPPAAGQEKAVDAASSSKLEQPEDEPGNRESGNSGWNRSDKRGRKIPGAKEKEKSGGKQEEEGVENHDISPENRRFILKVLQKHFLFAALEDDERASVVNYMQQQKCKPAEVVFNQGEAGDCCFIIQSGVYTVSIDDRNVKQLRSKHTFGELAMLYNVNRTATVTCSQEGRLWKMDGRAFRLCMDKLAEKHEKKAFEFLNKDPTFCSMSKEEKKKLASVCTVQVFTKGEQILRDGEVGDWVFIVIEGTVQTNDRYGNLTKKKAGTILGSAGLMYTKQQVSGAKAIENVSCLALSRSSIERLIGSVEDVLRRSAIKALLVDNVSKSSDLAFFKQLTNKQQDQFIEVFEDVTLKEGEVVIQPGALGQMVVVIEGEAGVMQKPAEELAGVPTAKLKESAKQVLTSGMTYGAGNILNNKEMKHSVVALTSGARLHRVGHSAVMEALKANLSDVIRQNEISKVLSDIFLFKNLTDQQMDLTVKSLNRKSYKPGETIVKQGDDAERFYLIQEGTVLVNKDESKIRNLGRWDYFGERALIKQEKRSATCIAEDACVVLSLDSKVFSDIVGIFRKELVHRMNLQDLDITMKDLRLKAVVGRGSFGIVKLVHHKSDDKRCYALKCVGKKQVVRQGQQKSMCIEREINAQCYHPCIMQFIKTFQDSKNVYFLTEFLGGGDLFYAIREIGNLSKAQSQFYSGSIACALEYLHARSILYRDLKPENVLLDFIGNAKLVDFGCCKIAARTNTLVGTPEYFAPETILGKGYTAAIDWWALGVMLHEFVVGPLPFGRQTEDQLELFREILEAPLQFPNYIEDESAISIINGLLERTPELRLGASTKGAKELKEHGYYNKFDWDALAGRYMKPPWTPNLRKLQSNWELCKGEAVEEGTSMDKDSPVEPGMEWAQHF